MDELEPPPVDSDDLRQVITLLEEAIHVEGRAERVGRLGPAVRALTRLWSDANPTFDSDAWYPVSYLLSEHWEEIQSHMER